MKNGGKNKSVVFITCSVCIHTHTQHMLPVLLLQIDQILVHQKIELLEGKVTNLLFYEIIL